MQNTAKNKNAWILSLMMLVGLALLAMLSIAALQPPRPPERPARAGEFSLERAVAHVARIARQFHPVGTAAHDDVRDYITAELDRLGLAPQVQEAVLVERGNGRAVRLGNVMARLAGSPGRQTVMLVCHYDSAEKSYGASDDGAGVAAVLETARLLKQGPPLQNDVIFLFTDGEEDGLCGARAFMAEHPWARQAALVINTEARGCRGPALMFETSTGNRQLVNGYARGVPDPRANSLSVTIYRMMPNDTDLSVFRRSGLQGLNLAFVEGVESYHTPLDSLSRLDRGSLQHLGVTVLALVRYFGNTPITRVGGADAVFFNVFGSWFVHYPANWALFQAGLAVLFFAAILVLGFKRGQLRFPPLVKSLAAWLVTLLAAAGAGGGLQWLFSAAHGRLLPAGRVALNPYYLLGVIGLAVTLVLVMLSSGGRRWGWLHLAVAFSGVWALLTVLSAIALPGGSYLFGWPALFFFAALLLLMIKPQWPSWARLGCPAAGAAAMILLWAPILDLFFIGLGLNLYPAMAFGLLAALLTGLVLLLLEPLFSFKRWLPPMVAGSAFIVLVVIGAGTTRYTSDQPGRTGVQYWLDQDAQRAYWVAPVANRDRWTAKLLNRPQAGHPAEHSPAMLKYYIFQAAPVTALPVPEVKVISDLLVEGNRRLQLLVSTSQPVRRALIKCENSEVGQLLVNGQPARDGENWQKGFTVILGNPGPKGFELSMSVKGNGPITLVLRAMIPELPADPGLGIPPVPPELIALDNRATLQRTVTF